MAELAASGQTNREVAQRLFVTQKTVEAHLARTFRKLGIESGAQLTAALAAQPLVSVPSAASWSGQRRPRGHSVAPATAASRA